MALTKDQWYKHPQFRSELAELLQNKTLQIALDMTRVAGLKPTPFPPGLDLMQFFALMGAKRDGYFEGLTNLEDLAKSPPPPKPPERKPFETPRDTQPADNDRTSAP